MVMESMEDPLSYKIVDTNSDSFEQLGLLAIFIQNIFFSIIFMFVIVAYFVITSVTSLAIEQKNQTFNIIRSIGAPRKFVIGIVVVETLVYAAVGTGGAYLSNLVFRSLTTGSFRSALSLPVVLDIPNIYLVLAGGILLPLFAAMSSLKVPHRLSSGEASSTGPVVQVKYKRFSELSSFTGMQTFLGLELFVLGMSAYYFAPLAFTSSRLDLFLLLMTSLFMCAVAGSVILAERLRRKCMKWIVVLVTRIQNKRWMSKLVDVGCSQTRSSNGGLQSVWIVVCFAVCFVIFSGSGITAQIKLVTDQIAVLQGADILVQKTTGDGYLMEKEIRELLASPDFKGNVVVNASFASVNLRNLGYGSVNVKWQADSILSSNIYGVETDILYTLEDKFYKPVDFWSNSSTNREVLPSGYENFLSLLDSKENVSKIMTDQFGIINN